MLSHAGCYKHGRMCGVFGVVFWMESCLVIARAGRLTGSCTWAAGWQAAKGTPSTALKTPNSDRNSHTAWESCMRSTVSGSCTLQRPAPLPFHRRFTQPWTSWLATLPTAVTRVTPRHPQQTRVRSLPRRHCRQQRPCWRGTTMPLPTAATNWFPLPSQHPRARRQLPANPHPSQGGAKAASRRPQAVPSVHVHLAARRWCLPMCAANAAM